MKEKIRVYIASPYTNGDREKLAELQMDVAAILLKSGFNPYAPLYNHYIQDNHSELNYGFPWLDIDKSWLSLCDIMVRIFPKDINNYRIESIGADEEEDFAKKTGIPIFYFDNLSELEDWTRSYSKEKFFKNWDPLEAFNYEGNNCLVSVRCNIPAMPRFQVKAEIKDAKKIKEELQKKVFYQKVI